MSCARSTSPLPASMISSQSPCRLSCGLPLTFHAVCVPAPSTNATSCDCTFTKPPTPR
ncbi:putative D4 dopamine receptor [Burkholderia pseudomallei S13]|nr:putative D4 dopamine receptor [Burkholderia pseudomallei S13]